MGCHVSLLPQPRSSCSSDPPDCIVLCSSIPVSTPVVNEDQAIDGVGVAQPTCTVIHDEYDWESEHEPMVKDDLLLSVPPPLFPDIIGDFVIPDFPCVNPSTDASTFDHLQNAPNVSTSFDSGEDKFFIEHPLDFSSASHLPLYVIHQIMRMLTNILNFLILVIVISVLIHVITMLIHSLLICLRHRYPMIYLLTVWKPRRLLRHFSLG